MHEWSAVEQPQAKLSGFSVTDLFVNVHLDFNNPSRFTPFYGVGGGVSSVVLVFEGLRVRRTLANGFTPVGGVDPATETVIPAWQTRAAGTADSMSLLLAESTLGTNLVGGVAFETNERFSIALRGRYARYRDVRKAGKWDLVLRESPVRVCTRGNRRTCAGASMPCSTLIDIGLPPFCSAKNSGRCPGRNRASWARPQASTAKTWQTLHLPSARVR